jgi:hypothetical protein
VDRSLYLKNSTPILLITALFRLFDDIGAFHNDPVLVAEDLQYSPPLSLVLARNDLDGIFFF